MFSKGMPVYMRARERNGGSKTRLQKRALRQFVYMIPEIAFARLVNGRKY